MWFNKSIMVGVSAATCRGVYVMEQSLWQYLHYLATEEGGPLLAGAGVLLGWGLWQQQGWLLPVVAALLLLALALDWLWRRLRPDTLLDEDSFQYPEEALLPEEGEDLSTYYALGEALATAVAAEEAEALAATETAAEEPLPQQEGPVPTLPVQRGWLAAAMLAALTLLYCMGLEWLGFLPSTFSYLCLLLWLLGENHGVVVMLVPAVLTAMAALLLPLVGIPL